MYHGFVHFHIFPDTKYYSQFEVYFRLYTMVDFGMWQKSPAGSNSKKYKVFKDVINFLYFWNSMSFRLCCLQVLLKMVVSSKNVLSMAMN
jgi:hypothetical protein